MFAYPMLKILATGFTPFDDRQVNGSWIAASHLGTQENIRALEIPVIWGKPAELLTPIFEQNCPDIVVGFGEGREEWFDIESRASNRRDNREDNLGHIPDGPIDPNGVERLEASFNTHELQRQLWNQGWNIRVSADAGQFLCEELLYTLESLKTKHQRLQLVVFIHMPPFGTGTYIRGKQVTCGKEIITSFADQVLGIVNNLYRIKA